MIFPVFFKQPINPTQMKIRTFLALALILTSLTTSGQSKVYFVSPAGDDNQTGLSVKAAWKTLDKVNMMVFLPGDRILFESGGFWHGQLKPQGSGEDGKPIILSSFGDDDKPVINIGRAEGAGIRLTNQSYWEISNMEITSGAAPEIGIGRQGIVAVAKGEDQHLKHIVITDCYIHDIWGQLGGNTEYTGYYSCGILVNIQRDRNRDRTRPMTTTIDDVLIERNRIERMDKCGIISWGPVNNVIVRNNIMDNLGGDGIFVNGPYRGIIEYNIVRRSCMRSGNLDLPGGLSWWPHTAAIWIQNTNETVMQFNEVYDTGREKANGDGNAYDFDFNCKNCICQYNYSKNNHGFLLIMNQTFGNIARYNISENDKTHLIQFQCDTTDRNIVHNNVFYVDYGTADLDYHSGNADKSRLGANLHNNIFYATGQGRFRTVYTQGNVLTRQFNDTITLPHLPKTQFYHNCYFGPWKNGLPDDPEKLVADPLFTAPGTGGVGLSSLGGYKLKPGSPCINTGIFIPWNSKRDFYGNPVNDGSVDIGAYEQIGSGVFANVSLENEMNNKAEVRSRVAWAKRTFPASFRQPVDGKLIITLREPLDSHITGTISLNKNEIKAKPATIQFSKSQDRKTFTFTIPVNTQIPAGTLLHIAIEDQGVRDEWDIPLSSGQVR
jgi:hypothetical protein